jgi:hypothetical protein
VTSVNSETLINYYDLKAVVFSTKVEMSLFTALLIHALKSVVLAKFERQASVLPAPKLRHYNART